MWYSFDGFTFEPHSTEEAAKKEAHAALDEFRDSAGDGWDECVHNVSWGRVIEAATVTEDRPRTEDDYGLSPDIEFVMQVELKPSADHEVTAEWLRQCGGHSHSEQAFTTMFRVSDDVTLIRGSDNTWLSILVDVNTCLNVGLPHYETQGGFRTQCAALGIPLNESEGE